MLSSNMEKTQKCIAFPAPKLCLAPERLCARAFRVLHHTPTEGTPIMSKITADYRRAALRNGVVIRSRAKDSSDNFAYAAVLEMANYGYRVNPDDLLGMSTSALEAMLGDARAVKGADRDMTPLMQPG